MREKLGGSDFFQINDSGNECAIDRFEEYSIAWTLLLYVNFRMEGYYSWVTFCCTAGCFFKLHAPGVDFY